MVEPTLALQTAVHASLTASPAVTALVLPEHIRAGGGTRPDEFPCIRISDGDCAMLGRAAGGQFIASVALDLHVWTAAGSLQQAKEIGAAVARVLMDWPLSQDVQIDNFKHVTTAWSRDPKDDCGHGILSVEAVVRWRL